MPELGLFNIPAGAPFLDTLAEAMLAGRFGAIHDPADPAAMARATLYLPTRRAARAFAACLAARLGGRPFFLPRIVPLGDVDDAETALIGAGALLGRELAPIDPLLRRMLLTRLVDAWGRSANRSHLRLDPSEPALVPATLAEAHGLAGDLAALIDDIQTEGVPVEALARLDAARFDTVWQLNASFLAILAEAWPAILREKEACDPAAFRNAMLKAECERLAGGHAPGPIVAAGSTGTIPATARLLAAIAKLPNGAVVLPGLDTELSETAWSAIAAEPAPSHPQAALQRLLGLLQATREDVRPLGAPDAARAARAALAREALLPASVTEQWAGLAGRLADHSLAAGFAELALIEARDEREEALAIAIALRETLEQPGRNAALITPDRGLAERVAVELGRWGVAVDDSAGLPLGRWPAGALLGLVLEAALAQAAPASLVALLAHPCCRLGLAREALRHGACALEIGCWRGVSVGRGLDGLRAALAALPAARAEPHAPGPRRRLSAGDERAAALVLERVAAALAPLIAALGAADAGLASVVAAARAAWIAVATPPEDGDPFAGPDGEALALLFEDLAGAGADMPPGGAARDFVAILESLLAERVVRRPGAGHPRVKIWGLLEARLLEADHVVLAGLNETVWPPEARTDSFLNRPMRAELGLSPPERRIGQTAHDLVQALMARQVTLARARKSGEAETIPSRFWLRLKAVTPAALWEQALAAGARHLALAAHLSRAAAVRPVARPAPCPPRALQPLTLSVTEVETLYRDPYQIHARKILKLDALEDLLAEPDARERGNLLHEIVAAFAETYPGELPADAHAALVALGARHFAAFDDTPEVRAFWWPRFLMTAEHFIAWEARRRPELERVAVERSTAASVRLADGAELRLSGRADRIEIGRDGRLRIIDFKTGAPPTPAQVEKGFAPQLTLQAELAARAGFRGLVGPSPVEDAAYVKLHHDAKVWARGSLSVARLDEPLADLAARHLVRLIEHVEALRAGREPFLSRRAPDYIRYASPYDHLARVKEWAAAAGADEGEEP